MALSDRTLWLDGRLAPMAEATVPLLAQSLQRGSLVFDVFGVLWREGEAFGLGAREHVERFVGSCALMGLPLAHGADELLAACAAVVRVNPGVDSVRLNAYWADPCLDIVPLGQPTVAVAAYAVADVHPPAALGAGGSVPPARVTVPGLRKTPADVLPTQAKVAAAYAAAASAKAAARAAGFHDLVLLDDTGGLTETGTMSFFLVVGGVLRCAGLDVVLDGITRRVVLDLAVDEGISVEVGPLPRALADAADEVFLASTTRNIWPVECLDTRVFAVPGPVTARLHDRFTAVLEGTDPVAARWLQPL